MSQVEGFCSPRYPRFQADSMQKCFWSRLRVIRLRAFQSTVWAPLFLLGGFLFNTLLIAMSFKLAKDGYLSDSRNPNILWFSEYPALQSILTRDL